MSGRLSVVPQWGATRTTPISAATPGIWRRSRAAEFYFRLAIALRSGAQLARANENARFREHLSGDSPAKAAFERGDKFMRTVQAYTPPSGDLSEQFDRTTGSPISAKHLAWSYAAFITAAASRRRAAQAIRG